MTEIAMSEQRRARPWFGVGSQLPFGARAEREMICAETIAACLRRYSPHLRAIVLTGSLARDEATLVRQENGWRLLGDADYLLVFKRRTRLPADHELDELAREIETHLSERGTVGHIGLNSVHPSYFRKLPAHSFSYELRVCGQVIWGDVSILNLVPEYSPTQLSKEDAWRTICHRMIELLACLKETSSPIEQLDLALQYATVKLYLDVATSYLIFAGQYEPTYRGRERRFRVLAEEALPLASVPFPLKEFSRRVSECTEWKLCGPQGKDGNLRGFLEEAINYARQLWHWEAVQLTSGDGSSGIGTLVEKIAGSQTITERVRGWLSLLRRTGWRRSLRDGLRWARLSRLATPRYLIYQVAVELFWRLPCLLQYGDDPDRLDVEWDRLRTLLPQLPQATRQPVVGWQEMIADVTWNYEKFLLGTRA